MRSRLRTSTLAGSLVLASLALAGCADDRVAPSQGRPAGEMLRAAPLAAGALATPTVQWLAPLGAGTGDPATFASVPSLAVEVCPWSGGACSGPAVARFTPAPAGTEQRLTTNAAVGRYEAAWNLLDARFTTRRTYRIRVLDGAAELGAISVDVVRGRWALTRGDGTLAPLASASALPVQFALQAPPAPKPVAVVVTGPSSVVAGRATPVTLYATAVSHDPIVALAVTVGPGGPPVTGCVYAGAGTITMTATCTMEGLTLPTPGSYEYTATGTSSAGVSSSGTHTITATPPPVMVSLAGPTDALVAGRATPMTLTATATSDEPITGLAVSAPAGAPAVTGCVLSGAGSTTATATCMMASYTLPAAGSYEYTATATSAAGGSSTGTHAITARVPEIDVVMSGTRELVAGKAGPIEVTATATGETPIIGGSGGPVAGTGAPALPDCDVTPVGATGLKYTCTLADHTPAAPGTYQYAVTLRSAGGGSATGTLTITVRAPVVTVTSSGTTELVAGMAAPITITYAAVGETRITGGSGGAVPGTDAPALTDCDVVNVGPTNMDYRCTLASHTPAAPGTYQYVMTMRSAGGGSATVTHTVVVRAPVVTVASSGTSTVFAGVASPATITYTVTSETSITGGTFTGAGGPASAPFTGCTSTFASATSMTWTCSMSNYLAPVPGVYGYQFTVRAAGGGIGARTHTITAAPPPVIIR